MKSSNIGGQAVLEGIMMRHKDVYSVAVRKPDGEIEVKVEPYKPIVPWKGAYKIPIVRGVFSFFESLVVGTKCLMYSATFYEEDADKEVPKTAEEEMALQKKKEKEDKAMMTGAIAMSLRLCVGLFIMLPYFDPGGMYSSSDFLWIHSADIQNERYSADIYVPRSRA